MKKHFFFLLSTLFFLHSYAELAKLEEEITWKSPTTLLSMDNYEKLFSWLFDQEATSYALLSPPKRTTTENPSLSLVEFTEKYNYDADEKSLIGRVTTDRKDLDITIALLKQISEEIHSPELLLLISSEILAKVLAYRNLQQGDLIPIPTVKENKKISLVQYRVDRIFDLWKGMPAFGLIPEDKENTPPLLLFRGTSITLSDKASFASILSDFDPKGPGFSVFLRSRKQLRSWMQKAYAHGSKVRALGYSLGGSFVQYLSIYDYDLLSHKPYVPSIAFNQPGINRELFTKWQEIPNALKPTLLCFVVKGDMVSKLGVLFGSVSQLSLPSPLSPVQAHTTLMFAQPSCLVDEIDLSSENNSTLRLF